MSAFRATFVSHAHADNDLCDRYVNALRARGIDIWYDRDNAQNGHLLGTEIQRELQQRAAFVLLMTKKALDSSWVDLEVQSYLWLMAQDRSRLLLPVRIGSCAVPPFLNAFFRIDAQAMPFEQAIDAIASALSHSTAPSVRATANPATPPSITTPVPQTPQPSADLIDVLRACFLPQLCDALKAQDWPKAAPLISYLQRSVPTELHASIRNEVYAMLGREPMAERAYLGAKAAWDAARARDPLDAMALSAAADAASLLAPNDPTIAPQARSELLAIRKLDRFPPRLAELGFTAEKRNGVACIVPPVCQIPAGEFLMGSDPRRDWNAQGNEQPEHRVNVGAYAIARFPVTVAEYACFVDTGQRQPLQWQQQMQKLDHPVVDVSWDDAVAYAAWLAQWTGQLWRLPTEAEWEKAARWDQRTGIARLYPWGDSFDPSRANTNESGKRTTTAVGSYPNSVSPYGAEEMAGNVWELTHSLFKPYPYTAGDGREVENSTEHRVLRGGGWNGNQQVARAACRVYNWPDSLNFSGGFRLALGEPGSA